VVFGMNMRMVMLHFLMEVEMVAMSSQEENKARYHDRRAQSFGESPALANNCNSGDGADKAEGR
jgi:hypothetical protein